MLLRRLSLAVFVGIWLGALGGVYVAASEPDPRLGPALARRERPVLGSATAPIVVIEVSSFRCAHCRDFHEKIFPALFIVANAAIAVLIVGTVRLLLAGRLVPPSITGVVAAPVPTAMPAPAPRPAPAS